MKSKYQLALLIVVLVMVAFVGKIEFLPMNSLILSDLIMKIGSMLLLILSIIKLHRELSVKNGDDNDEENRSR